MEISPDAFIAGFIAIETGQVGALAIVIWRLGTIQGALNGRKD